MLLNSYSRVMLLTDRYEDEGVKTGDIGYIIEIYGDGAYEVEFSDKNGITIAQLVAQENELRLQEPT